MPSNIFDTAGLAIVAYAEVLADGTSPNTNSGVTTARVGTGQYTVTLGANQQQSSARDLIFVTPKNPAGLNLSTPRSHAVDDSAVATKVVVIYGGSPILSYMDSDFSVMILRTTIQPVAGYPT
jgi:hypothetical protein